MNDITRTFSFTTLDLKSVLVLGSTAVPLETANRQKCSNSFEVLKQPTEACFLSWKGRKMNVSGAESNLTAPGWKHSLLSNEHAASPLRSGCGRCAPRSPGPPSCSSAPLSLAPAQQRSRRPTSLCAAASLRWTPAAQPASSGWSAPALWTPARSPQSLSGCLPAN